MKTHNDLITARLITIKFLQLAIGNMVNPDYSIISDYPKERIRALARSMINDFEADMSAISKIGHVNVDDLRAETFKAICEGLKESCPKLYEAFVCLYEARLSWPSQVKPTFSDSDISRN
jgi:hypothetical protein